MSVASEATVVQAYSAADEAAGMRRVVAWRVARVVAVGTAWVVGCGAVLAGVVVGGEWLAGRAGSVRLPSVSLPRVPPGMGAVGLVALLAGALGWALGGWPRAIAWGLLAGAAAWAVLHVLVPQVLQVEAVVAGLQGMQGAGIGGIG